MHCVRVSMHSFISSGTVDMSLDSEEGCQLLRVLIQLAMSSHASLSAEALKLLIRHFSQRKEIVNGFKQVHVQGFIWGGEVAFTPPLGFEKIHHLPLNMTNRAENAQNAPQRIETSQGSIPPNPPRSDFALLHTEAHTTPSPLTFPKLYFAPRCQNV